MKCEKQKKNYVSPSKDIFSPTSHGDKDFDQRSQDANAISNGKFWMQKNFSWSVTRYLDDLSCDVAHSKCEIVFRFS